MMFLVVAVDRAWGIGYKGDLLAHIRADLLHFKELTLKKTVVYGSNTLSTFPRGEPLKNRKNLILHPSPDFRVEGATVIHSLDELFAYEKSHPDEELAVIGGASVYRQLLPHCSQAFVTRFERTFRSDVFFENLDNLPDWRLVSSGKRLKAAPEDGVGGLCFRFCVYERIENPS